jgi:ADP-heptose:LPS heptosyltransferase
MLIFRSGAYGDNLIITPVIRYLHSQGHELTVVTSKRGMEVFKNNPHIETLLQHREETPVDKLADELERLRKKYRCEKVLDFSESIEVALSQHPRSPNYKLPKPERIARFNRNFYEYSFEHAGLKWDWQIQDGIQDDLQMRVDLKPELFFEPCEKYRVRAIEKDAKGNDIFHEHEAVDFLDEFKFNVLLGMSGSGTNKTWPWTEALAHRICENFPDVHIITVGDERCRLIEPELEGRITNLSGRIPMRMSMQMTGLVDMVIAPDTGIIHAAGCYDTPKICLLGHNTRECITKHFTNDYSIEADQELAPCAPCLFMIYDKNMQCPTDDDAQGASWCMSRGLPLNRVYERFEEVYAKFKKGS